MRLDGALSEAASGLDSIAKRLATVSQKVANASTPGYVDRTRTVSSLDAVGEGGGVSTGVETRSVDLVLQGNLGMADAQVADSQLRQGALAAVDAASGTPGSGQDLASLVGALRDSFSTLLNDPANATQQGGAALARGVNAVGTAISGARQSAQDGIVVDVAAANSALKAVDTLSVRIVAARAQGDGTAGLEDERDARIATVTLLTGARFLPQQDGSLLAVSNGVILPQTGTGLAMAPGALAPGIAGSPLTVNGQPALLGSPGGRIGAALALRDTVLPGLQGGVDGFARALATGFAAQGLTLFTDSTGAVPSAGPPGFAQAIQVNPAVTAAPNLVRDGTGGAAGGTGNTAVIAGVLGSVLAGGSGTVSGQASTLVSAHATLAASAGAQVAVDTAVQTSLQAKLDAGTGVSVDKELAQLVQLQNSYGANAKVIAAVQSAWSELLQSVKP